PLPKRCTTSRRMRSPSKWPMMPRPLSAPRSKASSFFVADMVTLPGVWEGFYAAWWHPSNSSTGRELWLHMKTLTPPALKSPGRFEIGLVAAGLAALIALQLVLTNSLYLFHAHFWLDELFTFAIVSD